jgi:hypothetical protein
VAEDRAEGADESGVNPVSVIVDCQQVTSTMAKLKRIHPGEVLLEEFMVPMNLSQNALARAIAVPPRRINEIVLGKRAITGTRAEGRRSSESANPRVL